MLVICPHDHGSLVLEDVGERVVISVVAELVDVTALVRMGELGGVVCLPCRQATEYWHVVSGQVANVLWLGSRIRNCTSGLAHAGDAAVVLVHAYHARGRVAAAVDGTLGL